MGQTEYRPDHIDRDVRRRHDLARAAEAYPNNSTLTLFNFAAFFSDSEKLPRRANEAKLHQVLGLPNIFSRHSQAPADLARACVLNPVTNLPEHVQRAIAAEISERNHRADLYATWLLKGDPVIPAIERLIQIIDPKSEQNKKTPYPIAHSRADGETKGKFSGIDGDRDFNARRFYNGRWFQYVDNPDVQSSEQETPFEPEKIKRQLRELEQELMGGMLTDFSDIPRQIPSINEIKSIFSPHGYVYIHLQSELIFQELQKADYERILLDKDLTDTFLKMYARAGVVNEIMMLYNSFYYNLSGVQQDCIQTANRFRGALTRPREIIFFENHRDNKPKVQMAQDIKESIRWNVFLNPRPYSWYSLFVDILDYKTDNAGYIPQVKAQSEEKISTEFQPASPTSYVTETELQQSIEEFNKKPPFEIKDRRSSKEKRSNPIIELSISPNTAEFEFKEYALPQNTIGKVDIDTKRPINLANDNEVKLFLPRYALLRNLELDIEGRGELAVFGGDYTLLFDQASGTYKVQLTGEGIQKYISGNGEVKYKANIDLPEKQRGDISLSKDQLARLVPLSNRLQADGYTRAGSNLRVAIASSQDTLPGQVIADALEHASTYTFHPGSGTVFTGNNRFPYILRPSSDGYLPVQCDNAAELGVEVFNQALGADIFFSTPLIPVKYDQSTDTYTFLPYHAEIRAKGAMIHYDTTPSLFNTEPIEAYQKEVGTTVEQVKDAFEKLMIANMDRLKHKGERQPKIPKAVVAVGRIFDIACSRVEMKPAERQQIVEELKKVKEIWLLAEQNLQQLDVKKQQAYRELFEGFTHTAQAVSLLIDKMIINLKQ